MSRLTGFRQVFIANWWLYLLAFILIALFVRLGVWQLSRADEKKLMLAKQEIALTQSPKSWHPEEALPRNYQQIQVEGQYLPERLLLDNQYHNHRIGYDVISPLVLANKQVILVNRGWVPSEHDRAQLPKVDTPQESVKVRGYVYYPPSKRVSLGQMIERKSGVTSVIEWVDTQDIGHFLHYSVYPFIIRLDQNEPNGFVRAWPIVSMPPERHYAYAVQWFAMALAILIIVVALTLKKKYEK